MSRDFRLIRISRENPVPHKASNDIRRASKLSSRQRWGVEVARSLGAWGSPLSTAVGVMLLCCRASVTATTQNICVVLRALLEAENQQYISHHEKSFLFDDAVCGRLVPAPHGSHGWVWLR